MKKEITVKTTKFGTLKVDSSLLFYFPEGLIGLSDYKRFVLLPHKDGGLFSWLQSRDEPSLAIPIIDPQLMVPEYIPEINTTAANLLSLHSGDDLIYGNTVAVRKGGQEMSVNMKAPIIFNLKRNRAIQVMLNEKRWKVSHIINFKTEQKMAG